MPTISVPKERLWRELELPADFCNDFFCLLFSCFSSFVSLLRKRQKKIGLTLWSTAQEDFEKLCFEFGIELDEVVCFLLLLLYSIWPSIALFENFPLVSCVAFVILLLRSLWRCVSLLQACRVATRRIRPHSSILYTHLKKQR